MHQIPSSMLRQWALNNAWAWSGSCVCEGVMAPCSAVVWPPGRHESSVQSCSACRWAHNPADNSVKTTPQTNQFGSQMCGQLISVIRCTYNFLLPFSSYTLFRVVNFRCADMRLLFFQFITKQCSNVIYRQLCIALCQFTVG